jgi:hypothetical protein
MPTPLFRVKQEPSLCSSKENFASGYWVKIMVKMDSMCRIDEFAWRKEFALN